MPKTTRKSRKLPAAPPIPDRLPERLPAQNSRRKRPAAGVVLAASIIFLLGGIALGILFSPWLAPAQPTPLSSSAPPGLVSLEAVSTAGYVLVEPSVDTENVYFTAGCTRVGMATTDFQTYSIQNGLNKIIEVRPTVHDVLKDLADSYGMEVLLVKLDSKDGTELGYYASLFLKQGSKVVSLETRPSDATALAVRTGTKIWFKQDTFEKLGKDICT